MEKFVVQSRKILQKSSSHLQFNVEYVVTLHLTFIITFIQEKGG